MKHTQKKPQSKAYPKETAKWSVRKEAAKWIYRKMEHTQRSCKVKHTQKKQKKMQNEACFQKKMQN